MRLLSLSRRPLAALAAAVIYAGLAAGAAQAQIDTGSANFARYVALGDSLTAAFMSGGLLDSVQANSYPRLIHRQATGGSGFQQPTVSAPGIPALLDLFSLAPLTIAPRSSSTGGPTNLNLPRPYDNLAVPGFRVHDALVNPAGNQLMQLILRPQGFANASALQQALLLQPTFVTLWIGNNDVLGAATSGIVIDGVTLTPVAQFEADFRAIVSTVRGAGAQLAIATIPNVTAIPFVTTVPPVVVNPATNQPVLINGQPVPLIGPNGPLALTDRVLLSATAALRQGFGIPPGIPGSNGQPLGTQFFLDGAEQAAIAARVTAYNNVIRTVANEAGAALVDFNATFDVIARRGLRFGGLTYNAAFLTGGIFSYDGVHPTPFGYAFIANEFIQAINDKFSGEIPPVDLFPFTFGSEGSAGTLTEIEAAGATFSNKASESLRRSLRVPPTEELLRLLREGAGGQPPGAGPQPPRPADPVDRPDRPRPGQDGADG